jgi:hypothetical protein
VARSAFRIVPGSPRLSRPAAGQENSTPGSLKRFVDTEIERWAKIVRIAGVAGYV